ncbi:hypothetical protein ACTFIV_006038 [Dictyostelium citrinum]
MKIVAVLNNPISTLMPTSPQTSMLTSSTIQNKIYFNTRCRNNSIGYQKSRTNFLVAMLNNNNKNNEEKSITPNSYCSEAFILDVKEKLSKYINSDKALDLSNSNQ